MRRSPLLLSALLGLSACGGSPPPVEMPVPPPVAAPVVQEPVADAAPSEPRYLLALARWKAPIKGVDEILHAFGSPVSVQALLGSEVSKYLETSASVDFALTLDPDSTDDDPKVQAAFSLPLRSFDDAKAYAEQEGPLTPVSGGALRLSGKGAKKLGACDLSPATGDATARLVCGQNAKDLDALRPWLSRGLPPVASASNDLIVTARAAPLRERYMPLLRSKGASIADQARNAMAGKRVSDPELLNVPGVLLDEGLHFLEDVDTLDLKVSFAQSPPELVTTAAVRFGAKSAWLTRVLTEANDRPSPPPAIFWRAPRDAYTASWGHGSDPHAFDGVRHILHKALAEALGNLPLPDADKGSLLALIDTAPRASGPWVAAQGILRSKSKAPANADAPLDVKPIVTAALGWTVTGVEAPAAEYVAWFKQGVDTYGRMLRLAHDFLALTGRGKGPDDPLRLAPKIAIQSSPAGWPKGTVAFDLTLNSEIAELLTPKGLRGGTNNKKPKLKGSVTVRLAIVPDGERTWIGFSADLDELRKRMVAVMPGQPDAGTLATREGLEPLRVGGQTWGGFLTLGDIVDRTMDTLDKELTKNKDLEPKVRQALAALPNHWRTPILLRGSGTGGDKPSCTAELRVEGGTLADVAALVKFLVGLDKSSAKTAAGEESVLSGPVGLIGKP